TLANAVSIAQLGLGAWQVGEEAWLPVVAAASDWFAAQLDEQGLIAYLYPEPYASGLEPPWHSAMAQGEAASLLVRAAHALDRPELAERARLAVAPLLDERSELVVQTPQGPTLEEYPTTPATHALNGWMFALWGVCDVGLGGDEHARDAFDA